MWGSFNMGAWSFHHTREGWGTKDVHPLKKGGGGGVTSFTLS